MIPRARKKKKRKRHTKNAPSLAWGVKEGEQTASLPAMKKSLLPTKGPPRGEQRENWNARKRKCSLL